MARNIFDVSKLRVGGTYSIDFTNPLTRKTVTFDGEYVGLPEGYIFLKGGLIERPIFRLKALS